MKGLATRTAMGHRSKENRNDTDARQSLRPSENQSSSGRAAPAPPFPVSVRPRTASCVPARPVYQLAIYGESALPGRCSRFVSAAKSPLSVPVNANGSSQLPPGARSIGNEVGTLAGKGLEPRCGLCWKNVAATCCRRFSRDGLPTDPSLLGPWRHSDHPVSQVSERHSSRNSRPSSKLLLLSP